MRHTFVVRAFNEFRICTDGTFHVLVSASRPDVPMLLVLPPLLVPSPFLLLLFLLPQFV
jgi:hypothetical protein